MHSICERLLAWSAEELHCTLRKASVLKVEHDFPVSCILRLKASGRKVLANIQMDTIGQHTDKGSTTRGTHEIGIGIIRLQE